MNDEDAFARITAIADEKLKAMGLMTTAESAIYHQNKDKDNA